MSKMPLPSTESQLVEVVDDMKHDKWGFVIYRCTYQDDQAWERFETKVYEHTQEWVQDPDTDTPEVANSLEWTFVENRAALKGASMAQLRERFNRRAALAVVDEQPRGRAQTQAKHPDVRTFGIPRYEHFIQIDEEALQSVLAQPETGFWPRGIDNFVDARWRPLGVDSANEEDW